MSGLLDSEDTRRTMEVMQALGATVGLQGSGQALITGLDGRPCLKQGQDVLDLDVGESGTTCRLIAAVAAAGCGCFRLRGRGRMHERPIGALAEALLALGVKIHWEGQPGFPPMLIETNSLAGGHVQLDLGESSQYLSGLLLAAPLADKSMEIEISGRSVSRPYVSLTLAIMADFGITSKLLAFEQGGWRSIDPISFGSHTAQRFKFILQPGSYLARTYQVEGDWSNASYFLAAGALGPHPVSVSALKADSLQGDRVILDILEQMGAKIAWSSSLVTVHGHGLRGIDVNMEHCPDLVPTVAAVAAQASGRTVISGVAHLRLKESDRLAAVAAELGKAGAHVEILSDGLIVHGGGIAAGSRPVLSCHGDHRLAMSLSLLIFSDCRPFLDDPACVKKSFPDFWKKWTLLTG